VQFDPVGLRAFARTVLLQSCRAAAAPTPVPARADPPLPFARDRPGAGTRFPPAYGTGSAPSMRSHPLKIFFFLIY